MAITTAQKNRGQASRRRKLGALVLGLLAVWVVVRMVRVYEVHEGWQGSVDYYTHWVAGLFILQGVDPYDAQLDGRNPASPIEHIDGRLTTGDSFAVTDNGQPSPAGRVSVNHAVNTPALILLQAPLSTLSWGLAKRLMFMLNVAMVVAIPWQVTKWLAYRGIEFRWPERLGVFLLFLGFASTSTALAVGQPAISAFFLTMVGLNTIDRGRATFGGVALGLALSKYPLSLPVAIYLMVRRQFRPVLIAVAVQVGGFIVLSTITQRSPLDLVSSYLELIGLSARTFSPTDSRVDLFSYFPNHLWLALAGTSVIIVLTVLGIRRAHSSVLAARADAAVLEVALLGLLLASGLLVIRHLFYDMMIDIIPIAGLYIFLRSEQHAKETGERRWRLPGVILGATALLHLLPLNFLRGAVTPELADSARLLFLASQSTSVLALVVLCLWAAGRWFNRVEQTESSA